MIYKIILPLLFFIMISCGHDERIIPRETMVNVLTEMHMADATLQIYNLQHKNTFVQQTHYDSIFAYHGITDALFKWNMAYYIYTKELEPIMTDVVTNLSKIEGELQKEKRKQYDEPEATVVDTLTDHEKAQQKLTPFDKFRFKKYDTIVDR